MASASRHALATCRADLPATPAIDTPDNTAILSLLLRKSAALRTVCQMIVFTAHYHRHPTAGRSFGLIVPTLLFLACLMAFPGCGWGRRDTGASGDHDGQSYNPGAWYGDADAAVAEIAPWDTLTGSADAVAVASDSSPSPIPNAIALPCGGATAKPDGLCCPSGQGWDQLAKVCQGFSLPECPNPATCAPKWCADWVTSSGQECPAGSSGCHATPRPCSPGEVQSPATCTAGEVWDATKCRAAGTNVKLPGGGLAAAELPQAASPALAPPLALQVVPPKPLPLQPNLQLCLASDVASPACGGCPVGQAKGASGNCEDVSDALPSWCPPGFVASAEAVPHCAPDPSDCGVAPYAGVAEGPGHWFVDSQAKGEPLGTQAAPFATLDQALAAAKASDNGQSVIALAAGTYAMAPGSTSVPAGVKVQGRCAHLTTLQAANSLPGTTLFLNGTVEGVTISGGKIPVTANGAALLKRVHLLGGTTAALLCTGCKAQQVLVSATQRGIEVEKGLVALEQVRIQESTDRGIVLAGGATAALVDVVITATKTNANGTGGYGLLLAEGASASGQGIRIVGTASAGIAVFDPATSANFSRVGIAGTKAAPKTGEGGHALLASSGAQLQVTHGRFTGNQSIGVLASGTGSQVRLLNCVVEDTLATPAQANGDGLRAQSGGKLQVKACLIQGNRSRGILVSGAGSQLIAERVVIRDTLPRPSDLSGGYGLWVEDGGTAIVSLARVQGNRSAGVAVAGKGSSASLQSIEVLGTLPSAQNAQGGQGLLVAEQAAVQLDGVRLSGNHAVGLWISDGASASGQKVVVDFTAALANQTLGRGIQVSAKGKLQLSDAMLYGNRDLGILIDGTGASLQLGALGGSPTIIAAMQPRVSDGGGGRGLQVQGGAEATVANAHFAGARELAVAVSGANSALSLSQVWVTETSPRASDLQLGRGIAAEAGAKLAVAGVTILQARDAGLSVSGAALNGADLWIDSTLPTAPWATGAAQLGHAHGRGLELSGKAKVQLQRVRLSRNHDIALSIAHTGTSAEIADLIIEDTAEEPATLQGGRGLQVVGGAKLYLRSAKLQKNKDLAMLVAGNGSALTGHDVRVEQTMPEAGSGARGVGLAVVGGAADVSGAIITGQRHYGVYSDHSDLSLIGTVVSGTQALPNGTAGQGVYALGGELQCWGCQVKGNRGAALVAQLSAVVLVRTALLASQPSAMPGSADLTGDGLLLIDCMEAALQNLVVAGNPRVGALLHGGSALVVGISLVSNGFAWSVQAAAQLISSAAVLQDNLQSVWTGTALPWFHAPLNVQARPVLGSAVLDSAGSDNPP